MAMPKRMLVVEDEILVAMMIEDALAIMGIEVAGVVGTLEEALKRAGEGGFDCALLDVHLRGRDIYPVADVLAEKGVPFIFATGYGQRMLPEKYRARPVLQKPFAGAELERVLATL
jgi:CheY-like chemotaxis protein